MTPEPKSACCKAAMKQGSNDLGDSGTTRYQVCTACGQPCDALAPCPTCGCDIAPPPAPTQPTAAELAYDLHTSASVMHNGITKQTLLTAAELERLAGMERELEARPTAIAHALLLDRAVQAESALEQASGKLVSMAEDLQNTQLRAALADGAIVRLTTQLETAKAELAAHKRLCEKLRLEGNALADAVERHLQNPDAGFIDASTTQRFYDALTLTAADFAENTEAAP